MARTRIYRNGLYGLAKNIGGEDSCGECAFKGGRVIDCTRCSFKPMGFHFVLCEKR